MEIGNKKIPLVEGGFFLLGYEGLTFFFAINSIQNLKRFGGVIILIAIEVGSFQKGRPK